MENKWDIEIKPKKKLLDVDIKGIWKYRDLYRMYVKRDIVTVYKQTILGPLWFLIQPIFTTIMYMFVFGGLAGISTDGAPQPLFYMSGILLWNYFNSAFMVSSNVFTTSWGLIISALTTKYRDLTQLVTFGIQLFMYATPVIYPLSAAPEKYRDLISLNPLTPIFEAFKYSCMGCGSLDWGGLLYSTVFMCITLFLSVVIFSRVERNFMDTV